MASAYSTPYSYEPYIQQLPMDAIFAGLQYKQQKFDANYERLNSFIQNVANIELAKDVDKEHLYNNLKMLVDNVNRMGAGDLSLTGATEQIAQYIGYAVDDKVINGIAGTKVRNNILERAEWYMDNQPDKFSQQNLDFSLRGIREWMNDGEVGSNYKKYKNVSTDYIPYTDVFDRASEVLGKMQPDITIVQSPTGDGFLYYDQYKQITEQSVINALDKLVYSDPAVAQQMRINSWATVERQPTENLAEMYDNYTDKQITKYEQGIAELKLERGNHKKGTDEYNEYTALIKDIESQVKDLESIQSKTDDDYLKYIEENRESVALRLYKDNFNNGIAEVFAYKQLTDTNRDDFEIARYKALHNAKNAKNTSDWEQMKMYMNFVAQGDWASARGMKASFGPEFAARTDAYDMAMASFTNVPPGDEYHNYESLFEDMNQYINGLEGALKSRKADLYSTHGTIISDTVLEGDMFDSRLRELVNNHSDPTVRNDIAEYLQIKTDYETAKRSLDNLDDKVFNDIKRELHDNGEFRISRNNKLVYDKKTNTLKVSYAEEIEPTGERTVSPTSIIPGLGPAYPTTQPSTIERTRNEVIYTDEALRGAIDGFREKDPNAYTKLYGKHMADYVEIPAEQRIDLTLKGNRQFVQDVINAMPALSKYGVPKEWHQYFKSEEVFMKAAEDDKIPFKAELITTKYGASLYIRDKNAKGGGMFMGTYDKTRKAERKGYFIPDLNIWQLQPGSKLKDILEQEQSIKTASTITARKENFIFDDMEQELKADNETYRGDYGTDLPPTKRIKERSTSYAPTIDIKFKDGTAFRYKPELTYRLNMAGGEKQKTVIPKILEIHTNADGVVQEPEVKQRLSQSSNGYNIDELDSNAANNLLQDRINMFIRQIYETRYEEIVNAEELEYFVYKLFEVNSPLTEE